MKRRKYLAIGAIGISIMVSACGNNLKQIKTEADKSQLTEKEDSKEILLYVPNETADGFDTKEVLVGESPQQIIDALSDAGALPEGIGVLSFQQQEDAIYLDFNEAYEEAVTSAGTTGEILYFGSVVNTFLKAYDAKQITITCQGKVIETGHNIYVEPFTFMDLEQELADTEGEAEKSFQAFLNGEKKVQVGDGFQNGLRTPLPVSDPEIVTFNQLDEQEDISFSELKNLVEKVQMLGLPSKESIQYAKQQQQDGSVLFLLQFQNTETYGDENTVTFVIRASGDILQMTYAFDSYSRSHVEIYEGPVLLGHGSSGAGDSEEWCGYVNASGHYCVIYERQMLYDMWLAWYAEDLFGEDQEWSSGASCELLDTADGAYYYCAGTAETDQEKLNVFQKHLESIGRKKIVDVSEIISTELEKYQIDVESLNILQEWILVSE